MKLYDVHRRRFDKYVVSARKPFGNAVYLCDEGSYPVTYIYRRTDINGSGVYNSNTCHDRKQLKAALKWHNEVRHTIIKIWTYTMFSQDIVSCFHSLVKMKISGYYETVVEADSVKEAKEDAWNNGDFGDAYNIDGDFISCEELPDD